MIFLGLLATTLGFFGIFPLLNPQIPFGYRFAESVYLSIHLFTISYPDYLVYETGSLKSHNINWCLQSARFLAPIVTVAAAIGLFSSVLEGLIKRARVSLFYRQHAIVYGFNLRSRLICEDLIRKGIKTIVLDPDLNEEESAWLRTHGIFTFAVSGAEEIAPKLSKAERAKYLFAAYDDDSVNMKILVRAYQRNRETYENLTDTKKNTFAKKYPTHCYVHFTDPTFKNLQFGGHFSTLDSYFQLRIFSVYDLSAKRLALSVYRKYAKNALEGKSIHFFLIGLGRTGQAMVEQLVRMSYFNPNSKSTITIFDEDQANWDTLTKRFPILNIAGSFYEASDVVRLRHLRDDICFPEVSFSKQPFDSALLTSGKAFEACKSEGSIRIALLCLHETTKNLALADSLLQQQRSPFADIFIRADDPQSEIRRHIKSEIKRKELSNFPSQDEMCTINSLDEGLGEELAQTIHEEYIKELSNSDPTQPSNAPWASLDESFKESNRRAAAHMAIKSSLLGIYDFDPSNPKTLKQTAKKLRIILEKPENAKTLEMLSICEHNRWSAEKLLANWVPGITRKDALKQHPNLIPWDLDPNAEDTTFANYAPLTEPDKQKDRDNIIKIPNYLEKL